MTATATAKRDRVVLENLRLVKAIAIRVHEGLPVHVDLDDLIHAGILGLFAAADKYDGDKNVTFAQYAKHRIKGAILDSLRQLDWASRDMRRRYKQFEAISRQMEADLHRKPTDDEVAARLGISVERWRQMLVDLRNSGLVSANSRPAVQEDLPAPDFPADAAHRPDHICARQELRAFIESAIDCLPERYRNVIVLYYNHGLTMKEIGENMGINESRVSQIHKSALARMAAALSAHGIQSAAAF
jgi:RNA polymerase sigma factor for flagellar operon FliA